MFRTPPPIRLPSTMAPESNEEHVRQVYGEIAAAYEVLFPGLHRYGDRVERFLAETVKPGCRVLDVGCGTGLLTRGLEPSVEVATGLFYGIKADTRDLGRETTQTDIDSYLWLFPRCDKQLLGQIEHPELPVRYFQLYHTAIERAKVWGTAIITDLEEAYSPDMVAEVAERLMFLEGMKWSLAYATYRNQLFMSLRVKDRRMNAGRLIREICEDFGGSSGGHGSMAGARIPLSGRANQRKAVKRELVRRFIEAFGVADERPVALLSAPAP